MIVWVGGCSGCTGQSREARAMATPFPLIGGEHGECAWMPPAAAGCAFLHAAAAAVAAAARPRSPAPPRARLPRPTHPPHPLPQAPKAKRVAPTPQAARKVRGEAVLVVQACVRACVLACMRSAAAALRSPLGCRTHRTHPRTHASPPSLPANCPNAAGRPRQADQPAVREEGQALR